MARLRCKGRQASGFTLIEILVVVVIIGITLAVIVPNLFPDERTRATEAAEQIYFALERARDEAVFTGRPVAAELTNDELVFFERDIQDPGKWRATTREALKPQRMPSILRSVTWGQQANRAHEAATSRLIFLPAGMGEPFTLALDFAVSQHRIEGDPLGNLHLSQQTSQP